MASVARPKGPSCLRPKSHGATGSATSIPLSREVDKLEQLKRSLAVYRLAFDQPRQDDLTAYPSGLSDAKRREVSDELRIRSRGVAGKTFPNDQTVQTRLRELTRAVG